MGEYPEAIAVMVFFEIGEIFEEYAEGETKKSIKENNNSNEKNQILCC